VIDKIDGLMFRDMIINASAAIQNVKEEINELNVFPVPDGDTGTNMSLTISAAATHMKQKTPLSIGRAAETAASAFLRGARGNSGVILSLLFRGMSKSLRDKEYARSADIAAALCEGVEVAYSAVMKPAEGTILTVSRLSSEAAWELAPDQPDIEALFEYAITIGYDALADTVNQNPVLKKAGVVDAGGKGYLVILEGMLKALRGENIEISAESSLQVREKADFAQFETEDINFAYCTEFIVERENGKEPFLLRGFLDKLGDSIVLVDDDEIIKVHVHTNEPGRVLTEALTYGSLVSTKIENMKLQHTHNIEEQGQKGETADSEIVPADGDIQEPKKKYGIVLVSAGNGLTEVFKDLGADAIITGGQTMNPSTDDILKAIESVSAEVVYVFPNNKNIILAAEQCARLSDKNIQIIPTKTIPQGISALLVFDPKVDIDNNTAAMREAMGKVRTAQITYASRDSDFDGKKIKEGEYLALIDNALLGSYSDLDTLLEGTAGTVEAFNPEFVTVFYGEDVTEEQANDCFDTLSKKLPDTEITLVYGGQPVYYYMISIE